MKPEVLHCWQRFEQQPCPSSHARWQPIICALSCSQLWKERVLGLPLLYHLHRTSRMELYLYTVPGESRTAIFLNSLDDFVFDVAVNLRLSPQIELAVTIPGLRTEFEPMQNTSIARWIFRLRYQQAEENVDDYLITICPAKQCFPHVQRHRLNYASAIWRWHEERRSSEEVLHKMLKTLDETREVARLK